MYKYKSVIKPDGPSKLYGIAPLYILEENKNMDLKTLGELNNIYTFILQTVKFTLLKMCKSTRSMQLVKYN